MARPTARPWWPNCSAYGADRGSDGYSDDGFVERKPTGGPEESSVTEAEDPPVRGHQPIAPPIGPCLNEDDRSVERGATRRPVVSGIAEREDPAIGRHLPVPIVAQGSRCRRACNGPRPDTAGSSSGGLGVGPGIGHGRHGTGWLHHQIDI